MLFGALLLLCVLFMLLPVIFHAVGEDVIALAEVIQQRIGNGADGHLTVALDVFHAAEGEQLRHAFRLQHQVPAKRCDDVVRQQVAHDDVDQKAQQLPRRGLAAGEENEAAGEIPDQTAKTVVDNGRGVLAEAGDVVEQEHQAGADDKIGNTDDQIENQCAVKHFSDFFHEGKSPRYAQINIYYSVFFRKKQACVSGI